MRVVFLRHFAMNCSRRCAPVVRGSLFGLVVVSGSCASPASDVLDLITRDGRMVRELVGQEPAAVLIYSASTCFGCGTPLVYWQDLANARRLRLVVLLAGAVTEADLRNLRIQRVPAAALLPNESSNRAPLPSEYVLLAGRVLERAAGATEVRNRRLWRLVDADSLRFPKSAVP